MHVPAAPTLADLADAKRHHDRLYWQAAGRTGWPDPAAGGGEPERTRHTLLHLVKAHGKLSTVCERREHGLDVPADVIADEVAPDLLYHAVTLADGHGVDLEDAFLARLDANWARVAGWATARDGRCLGAFDVGAARGLTVADLAALLERFEHVAWDAPGDTVGKTRHICLHMGKLVAKLASVCERREHGVAADASIIAREVVPDLVYYWLDLAAMHQVDPARVFVDRMAANRRRVGA